MENEPAEELRAIKQHLCEESKKTHPKYEWALHRIGQRALTLGRGRRMDAIYTAALIGINLYERVIIHDARLSVNGQIEKIRSLEASDDQVLKFLNMLETVVPQQLKGSMHPSIRLWPEEIIGLGALCGLPEDKNEREPIREAVKKMLGELERTKGRKFGQNLFHEHSGLFNGQSLSPEKQGFNLTADHLLAPIA